MKGSHFPHSVMVCVKNRYWWRGLGLHINPAWSHNQPLKRWHPHWAGWRGGSRSVASNDTGPADELISKDKENAKSCSTLYVKERSEIWALRASTDTSSHSLNLNKCQLANPLTVPLLRDKERKILIAFSMHIYSKKRFTSAGVIVCDWMLLLMCQDWLCNILDLDSTKEDSRLFDILRAFQAFVFNSLMSDILGPDVPNQNSTALLFPF